MKIFIIINSFQKIAKIFEKALSINIDDFYFDLCKNDMFKIHPFDSKIYNLKN